MTETITRMSKTHPAGSLENNELLARCVAACLECAQACTACADACLSEEMVADLRSCIRGDLDCADVCGTTARVLSRRTGYDAATTRSVLEACAQACRSCGEECASHGDMHEHCKVCAEVCRRCEEACRELLAVL
ncbi:MULTISPECIES: four-helix bundle copper-binding protein [Nocardioides]|uniref:Four-helix bundle copper-binding protein n=1 Tax=Nocardioides vastitatis TaxID=2568655 RepID=A0ABW0ZB16_9ACTN|nr:four-helix bundle copper-binding protein [Nocardioides sp.]THI96542.1 four-helix bundle copper-binding protein [Nocardioides sp.]